MSIQPPVRDYLDYDTVIKAIEKCSLQGTFGPEVTSTRALLSKESEASSTTSISASHNSCTNPIETPNPFNEALILSYKSTGLLPIEEANEGGNIPSKRTTDDSAVSLTKQEGNIPSDHTTNDGGYPILPGHENGTTSFPQSNYLGRVSQEKASYHKCTPFFR